ncbi:MAG TPA: efflux RND transporter periplasmic adaptor subunit [Pseudonocardia sp.]|uniref:HlyD family secretion protein n=1 Tax=Pseudonocardia sp. TaxID=60912 RepID=UPI002C186D1A|nr:efflux RND transporter periplasmic adaptor subunit [Pseudonocardia sp.]HTF49042.1 efflux RND transporter periplasmic adaptor subunit [Pseudonocardia sp.]
MEGPRGSNNLVNGASRRVDPDHVTGREIATEETATEETAADEIVADEAEPPAKKKRPRRRLIILAVVVLVLIAAGLGGWYLAYSSQFVSTDNAQVDGNQVAINAPAAGTLTGWVITQGTQVHTDQVVGRIQILGTGPQQTIKSPGNGTVAVNDAVEGQYVTAGTELATAYNFNDIYVTARVDETDIRGVHLGAPVDIDVDSYPGTPVTGTVEEIQDSAATTFNPFPQDNTTGNFQKVTQVIPVKIAFTNTAGLTLSPGMNVTVHIHKS